MINLSKLVEKLSRFNEPSLSINSGIALYKLIDAIINNTMWCNKINDLNYKKSFNFIIF